MTSRSAAETEGAGEKLGRTLEPGDLVLVSGDVGSGKTTFIRGACRALGVEGLVTSPTFTIGQRYSGRVPVNHVDLYRLGSLEGEDPALLDDYLGADAVTFVEWPAVAEAELEAVTRRVELEHRGPGLRAISVR